MPSKHSPNVSVSERLSRFIEEQVASGHFGTSSEVVRAGLRLLERDLASPAEEGGGSGATAAGEDKAIPAPSAA